MAKHFTKNEHPEDHRQIIGFIQKFKEEENQKIYSHFISKDALEKLMNDDKFGGIRLHYGRNDEGQRRIYIEGATEKGNGLGSFLCDGPICPNDCPNTEAEPEM
ncbi:hypothetical protein SAMN04515674_102165 [Pseudarcicella hirudinis]|uniref:Uncharacterized protein n=1 Tax=Pseudarcicella hirudinis TaxID=1079859 RepID=A0A1I5NXJ8_9BACT|nr:hypothetical protein [Pseudarcicella hirudinis]SFP26514.1 hypothetical protein SAMN04515674_102165 [Pseudarcicella hirudinis]